MQNAGQRSNNRLKEYNDTETSIRCCKERKRTMKIFNWEKNKTLYRYLKHGDLFCFKIADKLFGYGRLIAKNKLGATVGIFDLFTLSPVEPFDYKNAGNYPILFKTVLDCHTLFVSKLESDWRIIAQDPDYQDLTPSEITSINPAMELAHNADFSIEQEIDKEDARQKILKKIELLETPRSHYHILSLLIRYKPEIFCLPIESFEEFGDFIRDEFYKIHHRDLKV